MSTQSSEPTRTPSPGAGGGGSPLNSYQSPAERVLRMRRLRPDETLRFVIFNIADNDERAVRAWLKGALPPEMYASILKVSVVQNTSRNPRADLWIRREIGEGLKRTIMEAFRGERRPAVRTVLRRFLKEGKLQGKFPWYWRMDFFRSWRDRTGGAPKRPDLTPREPCTTIATWNVNGYHSKSALIEDMLKREKVAVCAIQETLVAASSRPIRPKGYTVYCSPWEEGFRGHALIVDNRLPCYRIPHDEKWIIHVKISNWRLDGTTPRFIHVLAVYFPSGGNFRGARSAKIRRLNAIVDEIAKKHPDDLILALGDWNMTSADISNRLASSRSRLSAMQTSGSNISRIPVRGSPSAIDHFVGDSRIYSCFRKPVVIRKYAVSDHRPVVLTARTTPSVPVVQDLRYVFNKQTIERCREALVNSSSWDMIDREVGPAGVTDQEDMDHLVKNFTTAFGVACSTTGVRTVVGDSKPGSHLPRFLKKLHKKLEHYQDQYAASCNGRGSGDDKLRALLCRTKKSFSKKLEKWKAKQEKRSYFDIANRIASCDMKRAWSKVKAKSNPLTTGANEPMRPGQPLRDKAGKLWTDPAGIQNVLKSHYEELLQDCKPDRVHPPTQPSEEEWDDEEAWISRLEKVYPEVREFLGDEDTDERMNVPIRWPEVMMAIRAMNGGTAPGTDSLHIDVFKGMVREECMAALARTIVGFERQDNIQVDLPRDKLPNEPLTKMGKWTYKVLTEVWETSLIPCSWRENVIVSLYKAGDPELPNNYRGVTLISVLEKILTGVMLRRMETVIDPKLGREQAGFRKGEEAISHVVALADVVRRRYKSKDRTYGLFVDFKKAYDKVPHALLWICLKYCGIKGRMLHMLQAIYHNTEVSVRAGGGRSEAFTLKRGLRQGCLLSPLLFAIVISGLTMMTRANGTCEVNALPSGRVTHEEDLDAIRRVGILLYADDALALFPSYYAMNRWAQTLWEWSKLCGMELGYEKCGFIRWDPGGCNEVDAADSIRIGVSDDRTGGPAGIIYRVRKYKYLGIWVDENLPIARDAETPTAENTELLHGKLLASRGRKALFAMRPLLVDPLCPIGLKASIIRTFITSRMTYGSELIGFRSDHVKSQNDVLVTAAKWAVGKRGASVMDAKVLLFELGLPSMEEVASAARTRLWAKAVRTRGGIKSYLGLLARNPWKTTTDTWTSGTKKQIKRLLKGLDDKTLELWVDLPEESATYDLEEHFLDIEEHAPEFGTPEWVIRGRTYELHVRSNEYRSFPVRNVQQVRAGVIHPGLSRQQRETLAQNLEFTLGVTLEFNAIVDATQKPSLPRQENKLVRAVRFAVVTKDVEKSTTVAGRDWYYRYRLGVTRGFLRNTIFRPDLNVGIRWLVAIRTHSFPTVNGRWQALTRMGMAPQFDRTKCPLCQKGITNGWEWAHLMLGCINPVVANARRHLILYCIESISAELYALNVRVPGEFKGRGRPASIGTNNGVAHAIAVILVGGVVDECYKCSWSVGFGQTEVIPSGARSYTYVYTAHFLEAVMQTYLEGLEWGSEEVPGEIGVGDVRLQDLRGE